MTTDDRGEATLRLEVDAATPPGMYCVAPLDELSREGQLENDPCRNLGHHHELVVASVTALSPGDSGPAVAALRDVLRNRHAFTIEVDGIFGERTEAAVRQFQAEEGLVVDGIADPATLNALGFAL